MAFNADEKRDPRLELENCQMHLADVLPFLHHSRKSLISDPL